MNDSRNEPDRPVVETANEARQAEPRFGIRVLIISIVLAVLGFIALYMLVEVLSPMPPPATIEPDPSVTDTQSPPDVPPAQNDTTVTVPTPEPTPDGSGGQ